MSGHSKWSKIKRKKGANDAKRGTIFTKLSKAVTLAASEGGGDPDMNFALRLAVDKAKEANMPIANIDRAIKKGIGEGGAGTIQRMTYEGTGPEGSLFIVMSSTDNTNRTVSELRKIFEVRGGNLGASGTAMWQFEEKGIIEIKPNKLEKSEKFGQEDKYVPVDIEEIELEIMEVEGIMDLERSTDDDDNEIIVVQTEKTDFAKVHKELVGMELEIGNAELQFIANDPLKVDEKVQEKILTLMSELDDHDDVESVFTNVDLA